MQTLLNALYTYAQEQRMGALLGENGPAYRQLMGLVSQDQEYLEALLEGPASDALSRYLDHRAEADLLEGLSLFRCGLSMGLELGRL